MASCPARFTNSFTKFFSITISLVASMAAVAVLGSENPGNDRAQNLHSYRRARSAKQKTSLWRAAHINNPLQERDFRHQAPAKSTETTKKSLNWKELEHIFNKLPSPGAEFQGVAGFSTNGGRVGLRGLRAGWAREAACLKMLQLTIVHADRWETDFQGAMFHLHTCLSFGYRPKVMLCDD